VTFDVPPVDPTDRAKKIIAKIYSYAADKLYEPLVIKGAFPLFGGDLHDAVEEQGRRAVEAAAGAPILDMPVGTGFYTIDVAERSDGLVVGADIAEGMVMETQRAAREGAVSNLAGVQADAHVLPFADEAFGAILCTNGLQVIPGLERTLAELHRVLRRKGTMFVSVVSAVFVGDLASDERNERLPTMLKSRRSLLGTLERAGFFVKDVATQRLATLIEAARAGA
jgi:demethylmenaquinone methyltransferase/2-methoxy-6-polyprenyl-1,4-benzoquinol methylase